MTELSYRYEHDCLSSLIEGVAGLLFLFVI